MSGDRGAHGAQAARSIWGGRPMTARKPKPRPGLEQHRQRTRSIARAQKEIEAPNPAPTEPYVAVDRQRLIAAAAREAAELERRWTPRPKGRRNA